MSPKTRELYDDGVAKFHFREVQPDVLRKLRAAAARVTAHIRRRVSFGMSLTLDEAIDRVVLTAGSSSPGHWYLRWGQTKGEVLRNPEFYPLLKGWIDRAPVDGFPRPWYTASLKDELRPMKDGKVKPARLFMPVDLVMLVAQVMVWGDMNDRFVSTAFEGGLGGGHLHGNWDTMVKRLAKFSLFGETDAHGYDTSQSAELRECVYEVRAELCEDHPLRALLEDMAVCPRVVLPDGSIWALGGGNPSGSFNTLVDNSILSMVVFEYVCECLEVSEVDREYTVTGDDLVWSTQSPLLTPSRFAEVAERDLGLSYDGGSLTDVSTVSFCQRRFLFDEKSQRYVAFSDPTRFWDSIRFNRDCGEYGSALVSQSLMIEHYWHPDIRRVCREFQAFLREKGVNLLYLSDREIERLHLSPTRPEAQVANLVLKELQQEFQWNSGDTAPQTHTPTPVSFIWREKAPSSTL